MDQLGTPEALAVAEIEAMPAAEIAEKVRLQNWVKKVILAVAFAIIILFAGLVIAEYVDAKLSARGTLYEEEITIISQNDDINNSRV